MNRSINNIPYIKKHIIIMLSITLIIFLCININNIKNFKNIKNKNIILIIIIIIIILIIL